MLTKQQMIDKLNFHFPSYGAKDGWEFGLNFKEGILFEGDNAASNLLRNDLGDGICPVILFLERHGWYVEHYDECTALAYPDNKEMEWDKLIEKSKGAPLSEEEKERLRFLQKHMVF